MARSPMFLFAVIITIAVCFVMVSAQMLTNSPSGGVYSNTSSPINQTAGLINTSVGMAPNWIIPAIFLGIAFVIITVMFLVKRR